MMKKVLLVLAMASFAVQSFAGYADQFKIWTTVQKAAVKQWIVEFHSGNPGKTFVQARDAFNARPVTAYNTITNVVTRDDLIDVAVAQMIANTCAKYSIVATNTPQQIQAKFLAAYNAAATTYAAKDAVMQDQYMFWIGYTWKRSVQQDASPTTTQIVPNYTYGNSPRMTLGLSADVTCDDLEEAYRYQP